jgi:hypothetical protein
MMHNSIIFDVRTNRCHTRLGTANSRERILAVDDFKSRSVPSIRDKSRIQPVANPFGFSSYETQKNAVVLTLAVIEWE